MVSVSCFCVGKELLIGKTVNTNAYWVGGRLFRIGIMIDRILVVTDSLPEISHGLKQLLAEKPDFIIVIGGLGPTPDDMTLKGVARALNKRLRLDRTAVSLMEKRYASLGRTFEMTPARRKMAELPQGSSAIPNAAGTAPGVRIERPGTVIFCLPGVPKEMRSIYSLSVHPEIRKKVGTLYTSKVVMDLKDIFESSLAPMISQALKEHPSAYLKSHPKGIRQGRSSVELDIVVVSPNKERAEAECGSLASFFKSGISAAGGSIMRQVASTAGR